MLVSHVATGHWASVVPKLMAESFAPGRGLITVPIRRPRGESPTRLIGLIAARRDPHTPALSALIDAARALADRKIL